MQNVALEPTAATHTNINYCSTIAGVNMPQSHPACTRQLIPDHQYATQSHAT